MQERQIGKISEENTDAKHAGMTKDSKVISSELQKEKKARKAHKEWRQLPSGKT